MKTKCILALATVLFSLSVSAQVGKLDLNFNTDGDAQGVYIKPQTGNLSTYNVSNGKFNVLFDANQSEYNRVDLWLDNVELHAGNYPILAVKWLDVPLRTFKLHSNLSNFNNKSTTNNYTGVLSDNIFYYDLKLGFGTTIPSTTEPFTLTYLDWITTQNMVVNSVGWSIDWIKTFTSLDELTAYVLTSNNERFEDKLIVSSEKNKLSITNLPLQSRITIHSVTGKKIFDGVSTSTDFSLSVQSGILIVKVVQNDVNKVNKVVIQ